jgi:hypothetical protein
MSEAFDEKTFLYALSSRPEDAKKFATTFKPEWLHKTEFIPILAELYAFTRKHGEQPSIDTLHKVFKDKDEDAYVLRYKNALDSITTTIPDRSTVLYTLGQARDTGIVRDFQDMVSDQTFLTQQMNLKGGDVLKTLHKFFNRHGDLSEDRTMDIKTAIESLIDSHGFTPEVIRIPTGIEVIDEWSGGGLRTKQLGIIMAPTGAGKSAALVVMAHKMSTTEQKRVWMVTNELTIEEQTERFLSRLTGKELTKIINDPGVAYQGLDRHWKAGLHDRLRITEVNREVSMDDLESEMAKWVNLLGWKPDVLVLDFMERMKPCDAGFGRDQVWDWLGAISRDISRFAKRHNILVWTAAQTNRSGLGSERAMSADMAQGSIKHLQEATVVIGMRQEELPDERVVMEFTSIKQRHSRRSSRPVKLICNLAKMSITNEQYADSTDTCEVETPKRKRGYSQRDQRLQEQEKKRRE